MIDTLWIFSRKHVCKHLRTILQTFHPYLSGIVSLYLVFQSGLIIKPYALAGFFLPYNAVVFGFTAAAIALAIAIPSTHFILFLSAKTEHSTAFRDFLFMLAWNGSIHIFAFLFFLPYLFLDTWTLQAGSDLSLGRLYIFVLLWIQFYSCLQFFVTTIGIFELADLYAQFAAFRRKQNDTI